MSFFAVTVGSLNRRDPNLFAVDSFYDDPLAAERRLIELKTEGKEGYDAAWVSTIELANPSSLPPVKHAKAHRKAGKSHASGSQH